MMALLLKLGMVFAFSSNANVEVFVQANQAYDEADYAKASQLYSTVLESGSDVASVHYNLGNSLYREGKVGQAIFHFLIAQVRSPRDPDVKFNLEYVNKQLEDKVESSTTWFGRLLNFPINERESYLILILFSCVFWLVSAAAVIWKLDWLRWLRVASLMLLLVALIPFVQRVVIDKPFGVVLEPKTKVYSAIGRDNIVLFELNEGTQFTVAQKVDQDWIQLQLADGKKGWVRKSSVLTSGT